MIFSADETTDIGYESGTTVSADYTAATSRFTGKIHWVQIDVGDDDHDHFIDPEERMRIAMARGSGHTGAPQTPPGDRWRPSDRYPSAAPIAAGERPHRRSEEPVIDQTQQSGGWVGALTTLIVVLEIGAPALRPRRGSRRAQLSTGDGLAAA